MTPKKILLFIWVLGVFIALAAVPAVRSRDDEGCGCYYSPRRQRPVLAPYTPREERSDPVPAQAPASAPQQPSSEPAAPQQPSSEPAAPQQPSSEPAAPSSSDSGDGSAAPAPAAPAPATPTAPAFPGKKLSDACKVTSDGWVECRDPKTGAIILPDCNLIQCGVGIGCVPPGRCYDCASVKTCGGLPASVIQAQQQAQAAAIQAQAAAGGRPVPIFNFYCTNSAPAPYLVSPSENQELTGSSVTLNWGVSGWGTNCAGNANSFTVYVQECPVFTDPTTVFQSGLPASQTSISYPGQYTKSYCWAVTATNGALSTKTYPQRWTFTESNWWQAVGAGVTAAGDVTSKVAQGQVFVADPAGVVVSGSGHADFRGQPVSSTNWLVANTSSGLGPDLAANATFTALARSVDGLVTPATVSSPVVSASQLTLPAGLVDGAYYVQVRGDADLAAAGPLDVGAARIVLLVGGNVNIKNRINLTDNQGFFMVAASGNISLDPALGNPAYQTASPDLEGIYFAQGTFSTGSSLNYLRIEGSVVGMNGVANQRQVYSVNPAETYVFRPEMAVFAPSGILRKQRIWEEVAP